MSYDSGLQRMQALAKEFAAADQNAINEDTTRVRFIDTLLFECLGWNKFSQLVTEEQTDQGIVDYSLGDFAAGEEEGTTFLIVEAKKTGISFALPTGEKSGRLKRTIAGVLSLDKEIAKAMAQAARYAQEKGAPFAAIANGWQLVVFCAQLDAGVSWRKGNALVFDSLSTMEADFLQLWNALSAKAIFEFSLRKLLAKSPSNEAAPRRSATIANFDRAKNRNAFQADLQILGDLVFGGRIFEDRLLFHQRCYCNAGALSQLSRASRSYLEDRYPEFFSSTAGTPTLEAAQTKKGPAAALINLTNIRKPILLLGDVGVGKTTFIEHLFLVDWANRKEELIILRVDLADKPSRPEDLPSLVKHEIERSLREHYGIDVADDSFLRGVYHGDLMRFRKSPQGKLAEHDPKAFLLAEIDRLKELSSRFDQHLKSVFAHLIKGQKKMIVLVFDNVDQRGPELQNAAFIQAQIASSTWEIFTIVALRPETFVRAKLEGGIAGYHPRAFTISPPRFDQLIEKRILTAIDMLDGKIPIPNIGSSASLQAGNVADYLRVLQYSFAKEPELMTFCEDVSGGNMRLALDFVIAFMSCGHVDAQKILDRWSEEKRYLIPLHEFVRGVMFKEREYYREQGAFVLNVFDTKTNDPKEALAVVTVLSLVSAGLSDSEGKSESAGYLFIENIRRKLMSCGFDAEQASWALHRCIEGALLETNLKSGDLGPATHIRASPAGSYYFAKLLRTFVYVDAVCLDTPIADPEVFDRVREESALDARLERTRSFVAYLGGLFRGAKSLRSVCRWSEIERDLSADMEAVERSNARARQRREGSGGLSR
jgi:hypothetical protein